MLLSEQRISHWRLGTPGELRHHNCRHHHYLKPQKGIRNFNSSATSHFRTKQYVRRFAQARMESSYHDILYTSTQVGKRYL